MNDPSRSASRALEDHVGRAVSRLQAGYIDDVPSAVADLARLRRAIGTAPGADPTVWSILFERWPPELAARTDEPTPAEHAAHAALTLFAVHQQSKRRERMHQPGRSLGRAVGELARRAGPNDVAVRRRFDALVTAGDLREVLHHGRGLVTQLRGESVGLDYGLLAMHLFWLQDPKLADLTRLRWARDFYPPTGDAPAITTTNDSQDNKGESA